MVLRKSFYIRWSAGRSPRVYEVNPGWDPSLEVCIIFMRNLLPFIFRLFYFEQFSTEERLESLYIINCELQV